MQLIGTTVAASGISAQDSSLLILGFLVFGFVLVLSIFPFVSLVMIIDESVRMSTMHDHKLKVLLPAPPSKLQASTFSSNSFRLLLASPHRLF